jgi:hypothetical protein
MTMFVKISVVGDVTPCSVVGVCQRLSLWFMEERF